MPTANRTVSLENLYEFKQKIDETIKYKALYHLGVYDSVDTSNADYDLITRGTGYVDCANATWTSGTSGTSGMTYWETTLSGAVIGTIGYIPNVECSDYALNGSNQYPTSTNYGVFVFTGTIITIYSQTRPSGSISYALATPYTEKVFKNLPISQLDQAGENWLRGEYEKGLNLWDSGDVVASTGGSHSWRNKRVRKTLPAGFYTIVSKHSGSVGYLGIGIGSTSYVSEGGSDNPHTFSLTQESEVWFDWYASLGTSIDNTTTYSNIMLNSGVTAYPFQPYCSEVARKPILGRSLYNLGAYDSVDTSNSGYDVITRRTIWINSKSGWHRDPNTGNLARFYILISQSVANNIITSNYPIVSDYSTTPGVCIFDNEDGNWCIGYKVSLSSANICVPDDLEIQVQRASTYIEKHIKDQPLSTLDQNGESWLRSEYEKGLNLWNASPSWSNSTTDSDSSFYSCVYVKGVIKGEERQASDGFKYITFTTPDDTNLYFSWKHNGQTRDLYIIENGYVGLEPSKTYTLSYQLNGHYPSSAGGLSISNIMLNEGSTPNPFIEYSGPVAHAANVEGVLLWKNGNFDAAFGESTISVSDMSGYNYLMLGFKIISGGNATTQFFKISLENSSGRYAWFSFIDDTSADTYKRTIKINSMTSITFNQGYRNTTATSNACIPVAIYGIK